MLSSKLRVLVVDDEKNNLVLLSNVLREEANISLANSGESGIEKAKLLSPDLILLDVMLPDKSGFEVMKLLKADKKTSSIPVIFVTGLDDVDNEEQGFELGACDYIHKPFHLGIVKARVKLHLTLARQRIMLEQLANIDPLTSIANRRRFDEHLNYEWSASIDRGTHLLLAIIDIDEFKQYNDHYGHAQGDQALSKVAKSLSISLNDSSGFVARYGGEEFVIVISDIEAAHAENILQKCLEDVLGLKIPHTPSGHGCITISIGAVYLKTADSSYAQAFSSADRMLYEAKKCGRNLLKFLAK